MRVAIDASALLFPATGIGRYVRELVSQLALCPDVEFWFHALRWSRELRRVPVRHSVSLRTAVKRAVPRSYEIWRAARQATFTVGAALNRIQLYHAPYPLPLRFRGPTVTTVHDLSFLRYPEAHPAERVRFVGKYLPKAIRDSRFILVDSDFIRAEVLEVYGAPPEKVLTAHLGVSDRFCPMSEIETDTVLERYALRHGKYLLSVGTLEPRKNLVAALEAFSMLPAAVRRTYPLAIAGMKGWLSERLEARIREHEERGEVRWLGYVAEEALPMLYAGARMLVYPSIYEGFGLPVVEAMASGVPVITSNQSSLPEVAGDAGIKADPHDREALRDCIVRLIEDRQETRRRIELGLRQATKFTWRACAEKTLAVYRRALAGH